MLRCRRDLASRHLGADSKAPVRIPIGDRPICSTPRACLTRRGIAHTQPRYAVPFVQKLIIAKKAHFAPFFHKFSDDRRQWRPSSQPLPYIDPDVRRLWATIDHRHQLTTTSVGRLRPSMVAHNLRQSLTIIDSRKRLSTIGHRTLTRGGDCWILAIGPSILGPSTMHLAADRRVDHRNSPTIY